MTNNLVLWDGVIYIGYNNIQGVIDKLVLVIYYEHVKLIYILRCLSVQGCRYLWAQMKVIMSRDGAAVARRAHNPKVVGSNPAPATKLNQTAKLSFLLS